MAKTQPEPDQDWLVSIRREFHRYPELGYQEKRTSAKISEILSNFGCHIRFIAETGVVAVLGDPGRPCLGFRADMDALPVGEHETSQNASYRSVYEGVMHACGHDAHVTIMLGLAKLLSEHPEILEEVGICVKFLFQPAEEGGKGAGRMVQEGALDSPKPRAILAAHMFPHLELGSAGLSETLSHAAADTLRIKVIGRGGHGARPDQCRDPIVAASHLVTQLQTIVSRWIPPQESAVLTIGQFVGGTAANVIPPDVEMAGTLRSFREETRQLVWDRMQAAAKGCESTFGVRCLPELEESCPACINHAAVTGFVKAVLVDTLGEAHVEILKPSMGAEDFAYYTAQIPGAIFRLGCANRATGICWDANTNSLIDLHSPEFDIDEGVLSIGVRVFCRIVLEARSLIDGALK